MMSLLKQLSDRDEQALSELHHKLLQQSEFYLGYPNNQLLSHSDLAPFLDIVINNIGDPFVGNDGINTCDFEKEVLSFFRQLFKIDENEYWGYVTRGGTEGNIFGAYLARDIFPDGILYYSTNTHYSVRKAAKLLRMDSRVIRSQRSGELDYEHLEEELTQNRHLPVIINANIGTTMRGATDRLERIFTLFEKLDITRHYIHCDGALFGPMHPFIEGAPELSFKLPIDSISVSGHKFLGSPIPCGIVITRKHLQRSIKGHIDYIGSYDSTIFGSRDGFSVLLLWKQIRQAGMEGMKNWSAHCMSNTHYALSQLNKIQWPAWKNDFSNIILIRRPVDFVCKKWHLATEADLAHIIIMPSVTKEKIDLLIEDLAEYNRY